MPAFAEVAKSLIANLEFAVAMAARHLKSVTTGTVLGLAWLLLRPLILTAAYVVIVAYVFGVKFGARAGALDYALYVLSGMVAWQAVLQSLEQAPVLVRERMEIVKQVAYPIETLPLTAMLVNWLSPAVALGTYLALAFAAGRLPWTAVLLPVPLALLTLFVLGTSWILMIVGVVVKDLREAISVVSGLLVYVSPVVLSEEMVGARLWTVIMLNPLAHVVVCFRDVLQADLHPVSWTVFGTMAAFSFAGGAWVVLRARLLINQYI
jgi:lipopolysaccharide transport system permease protein